MYKAIKIFCCYAHEDKPLLNKLKLHLRPLQRQGMIDLWNDGDISAGTEWEEALKEQLNSAQLILLLISPAFMDSDYCYSIEMKRAMERHEDGGAQVIPIILRHVYWKGAPFSKLQALPTNATPVMSSRWHNSDEAFFNIAEGIDKKIDEFRNRPPTAKSGNTVNGKREPLKEIFQPAPPLYMEGLVEKTFAKGGEVEPTLVMEKDHTTQIEYPELENELETNGITNEAGVSVRDVRETANLVGKQLADSIKRTRNNFLGKSPITILLVLFLLLLMVNIVYLPLQWIGFLVYIVSFIDAILVISIMFIYGLKRDYIFDNFKGEIPIILQKIIKYFKSD